MWLLLSGVAPTAGEPSQEVAFDYVPGAGDDEESWAKGLTPEVFWQNKEVNLEASPLMLSHLEALLHASF